MSLLLDEAGLLGGRGRWCGGVQGEVTEFVGDGETLAVAGGTDHAVIGKAWLADPDDRNRIDALRQPHVTAKFVVHGEHDHAEAFDASDAIADNVAIREAGCVADLAGEVFDGVLVVAIVVEVRQRLRDQPEPQGAKDVDGHLGVGDIPIHGLLRGVSIGP